MQKIHPKFLCDNLQDVLLTSLSATVQLIVLFGMPAYLVYFLTNNESIVWNVFIISYLVFISFSVFSLSISEEGIKFNRLFGTPKFLSWKEITEIELTQPKELILQGWFWPPFPAREMTFSLSNRGHYKISYNGGYCYFPPKNPEAFLALVNQYKSKAL